MTSSHPLPAPCQWFARLASALDRRSAPRLALLFLGVVLARGRRTVTSWIRAAGLSDEYRPCYTAVAAAGKRADSIAARLVHRVVNLTDLYLSEQQKVKCGAGHFTGGAWGRLQGHQNRRRIAVTRALQVL